MADSAILASKRFGRGTDLDAERVNLRTYYEASSREARDKAQNQRELAEYRRARLGAFADAVLRKDQWYLKALDGRGLMRKWVEEAQLDAGDDLDACIRCVVASCGCSTASN
jgi:hypothetical protein